MSSKAVKTIRVDYNKSISVPRLVCYVADGMSRVFNGNGELLHTTDSCCEQDIAPLAKLLTL